MIFLAKTGRKITAITFQSKKALAISFCSYRKLVWVGNKIIPKVARIWRKGDSYTPSHWLQLKSKSSVSSTTPAFQRQGQEQPESQHDLRADILHQKGKCSRSLKANWGEGGREENKSKSLENPTLTKKASVYTPLHTYKISSI